MSWSEERVEILKKLWLDGLSASQIAKQLGDVTRNAVIGKVHRLGLAGRASPSHPEKPTKNKAEEAIVENAAPAEEAVNVVEEQAPAKEEPKPSPEEVIKEAVKEVASEPIIEEEKIEPVDALSKEKSLAQSRERDLRRAKEGKLLTVLQLTQHVCKWPIGDPTDPEFGFCGAKIHGDWPYCKEHGEIAYQPQLSRRGGVVKQEPKEIIDEEMKKSN